MIELGQKVKDKVTGFTGIATAKIEYLNGCVQFQVSPKVSPKNSFQEGKYIDIEQLDVVQGSRKIELNEREDPSGGLRIAPPQRHTP